MSSTDDKTTTIYDVAKLAGVSPSTVTRALNNNVSVNEKSKEKVLQAAKELGYSKTNRTIKKDNVLKTIGLIVPDISNPFFPILIKGIEKVAKVHGYHIIVCDSENDLEIEKKHLQDFLDKDVSGIICTPVPGTNPFFSELIEDKFPLVILDRTIPVKGINFVTSDNREGLYQATKYLLDLGHKNILYIGGSRDAYPENDRFFGFKRAMDEVKNPIQNKLVIYCNYDWDKAYHEIRKFLSDKIPFTAVLATNDMMAYGVKKALEENNLRVPQDISIIGYDDIPFSSLIGLTTIAQPGYEMGRNAMILLIDLINGRMDKPQEIILNANIVIRESCKRR
ncbi:MAG: LacI family transcriptional regulator [Spirochaetes bacterium]|nr:LacI family transcriptional regulator [Spirochaetota bacterium]